MQPFAFRCSRQPPPPRPLWDEHREHPFNFSRHVLAASATPVGGLAFPGVYHHSDLTVSPLEANVSSLRMPSLGHAGNQFSRSLAPQPSQGHGSNHPSLAPQPSQGHGSNHPSLAPQPSQGHGGNHLSLAPQPSQGHGGNHPTLAPQQSLGLALMAAPAVQHGSVLEQRLKQAGARENQMRASAPNHGTLNAPDVGTKKRSGDLSGGVPAKASRLNVIEHLTLTADVVRKKLNVAAFYSSFERWSKRLNDALDNADCVLVAALHKTGSTNFSSATAAGGTNAAAGLREQKAALREALQPLGFGLQLISEKDVPLDDAFFFLPLQDEVGGVTIMPGVGMPPSFSQRWAILERVLLHQSVICWDFKNILKPLISWRLENQRPEFATPETSTVFDAKLAAWCLNPDSHDTATLTSVEDLYVSGPNTAPLSACIVEQFKNDLRRCEQIAVVLNEQLSSTDLFEPYCSVELPTSILLSVMEVRGVEFRADNLSSERQALVETLASIEKRSIELAGESFNVASPEQCGTILFERLELPGGKKTAGGGRFSSGEEELRRLSTLHPLPMLLLDHRRLSKLLSMLDSLAAHAAGPDGQGQMLNPIWLQLGTGTGRLSCSEPNLQNLHKAPVIVSDHLQLSTRQGIQPRLAGWSIVSLDFCQLELRVLAHLCQDSHLISLLGFDDAFLHIAGKFFGRSPQQVTPKQRATAKTCSYAVIYGSGIQLIAKQLDISINEASQAKQKFESTFPGIGAWKASSLVDARLHGCVRTLCGRLRRIDKINSRDVRERAEAERKAINACVQGSAADLTKLSMIGVDKMISEVVESRPKLILQVHDELVYEVKNDQIAKFAAHAAKIMCHCYQELSVPLQVSIDCGSNFGAMVKHVPEH